MEKNEHEFCLRCGRRLKNLKAREIGFGLVCLRKVKQENEQSRKLFTAEDEFKKKKKNKGCRLTAL